jgi:hypothetical protein
MSSVQKPASGLHFNVCFLILTHLLLPSKQWFTNKHDTITISTIPSTQPFLYQQCLIFLPLHVLVNLWPSSSGTQKFKLNCITYCFFKYATQLNLTFICTTRRWSQVDRNMLSSSSVALQPDRALASPYGFSWWLGMYDVGLSAPRSTCSSNPNSTTRDIC